MPAKLGGVAVNETTRDIYVVDKTDHRLDKLGPKGECLATVAIPAAEWVAVDNTKGPSGGDVYLTAGTQVLKFADEGSSFTELSPITGEPGLSFHEQEEKVLGVGVDANGTVWVYATNGIYEFDNAKTNEFVSKNEEFAQCEPLSGLAVSAGGAPFFVARGFENINEECTEKKTRVFVAVNGAFEAISPEGIVAGQFDDVPATGAAVDSATGTVYFDNGTSVQASNPDGTFAQRFGEETITGGEPLKQGRGIGVDGASDEVIVADATTKTLDIFGAKGEAPGGEPNPEEQELPHSDGRGYELVNPPEKDGAAIKQIGSGGSGLVQAAEDGAAITYSSTAPIVPGSQSNRSPEPTSNLALRTPTGWNNEGLALPRAEGATGGGELGGTAEYAFFTPDLSSAIIDQNPGTFEPHEPRLSPEATETTEYRRDLTRSNCTPLPSSCFEAIVAPNDILSPAPAFGDKTQFVDATPDARHVIVTSGVPLNAEGDAEEVAAAATSNQGLAGTGLAYEWSPGVVVPPRTEPTGTLELVDEPPPGEPGEGVASVIGTSEKGQEEGKASALRGAMSEDGSKVIWQSAAFRLYMRDLPRHETIRIDVPEKGVKHEEGEEPGAHFMLADKGMHDIFFTDEQRLVKKATRVEGVEPAGGQGREDLYVCEVQESSEGKPSCKLKDLTTEVAVPEEPASVQGMVGASEDGSTVYFVADGILAPHAGHGHCGLNGEGTEEQEEYEGKKVQQTCSLYVEHRVGGEWKPPTLIATLSNLDAPDWKTLAAVGITSRVSPNGQYVAFMSLRSLTGYDNHVTDEAHLPAQEVFVDNSVEENGLTCVSCDPGTHAPTGVLDSEVTSEGPGLVIDRASHWAGRWLAGNIPGWTLQSSLYGLYLSRDLLENGRLFFNATDQLVPADKNQKADVYEYEPDGVGSCKSENGCINLISSGKAEREAAFVDASTTGSDVFFETDYKIAASADSAFNLYDAHECTTQSPCTTEQPPPSEDKCSSEAECRGHGSEREAPPPVGPSTQLGAGNAGSTQVLSFTAGGKPKPPKLTNAQLLAKALKSCHKKHNKRQRQACERKAHKLYGKAAKHKGKKSSVRGHGR